MLVRHNPNQQWLLMLVPNPAIPWIDFDVLTNYVWSVLASISPPITVANFLAYHPAKFVVPAFFSADVCFPDEKDKTAGAASVSGGSFQQSGRQVSPIWVYCERILKMSSEVDVRHALLTRAVCHELFHSVAGLGHSNNPRDLMYSKLLPGPYSIDQLNAKVFRTMLGG